MARDKYFIVGQDIGHSLTPFLQSYWAKKYDIAADYVAVEKRIASFPEFILNAGNIYSGGNITMPFKNMAAKLWNISEPINTIKYENSKKAECINTDVMAFQDIVACLGKKHHVVLLGYGSVTKSILPLLAEQDVTVVTRQSEVISKKSDNVVFVNYQKFAEINHKLEGECFFNALVNCTNQTMIGQDAEGFMARLGLDKIEKPPFLVADFVYNPVETQLIKWARKRSVARIFTGLELFVRQAAESFKFFHDMEQRPDVENGINLIKESLNC